MGNEFGHPEWLDFPREGNDWSYHYCRRQWSLVDNAELRYQHLNHFDQDMIQLANEHNLLGSNAAQQLFVHNDDQVLAAERGNLLFIFNFHPTKSFPDYMIPISREGEYRIVIDSDSGENGGHKRLDATNTFKTDENNALKLYLPSRTCIAFALTSIS